MRTRHLCTIVRLTGVVFVLSVPAARAGAQTRGYAYAPGSYRYRVTTYLERSQDPGAGRPPFGYEARTTQVIRIDLTPKAADTLGVTITVDSIAVASSLAAPQPDLGRLRGATLTGTMSRTGHVYAFQPPAGADPETAALYAAFRKFFVAFPAQAMAAGSRWVDTTTDQVKREGLDVTTTTVTTSRVLGDTSIAGQPAWRVERTSEIAATGSGSEGGRALHLRNDGTIAGTHYFSRDGVYLGSGSTQRSELTLSTTAAEASVPIAQTIRSRVELLPTPAASSR